MNRLVQCPYCDRWIKAISGHTYAHLEAGETTPTARYEAEMALLAGMRP